MATIKGSLCRLQDAFVKTVCRNLKPCIPGDDQSQSCNACGTQSTQLCVQCSDCSTCCICKALPSQSIPDDCVPQWSGNCGLCNVWCGFTLCQMCQGITVCNQCGQCNDCKRPCVADDSCPVDSKDCDCDGSCNPKCRKCWKLTDWRKCYEPCPVSCPPKPCPPASCLPSNVSSDWRTCYGSKTCPPACDNCKYVNRCDQDNVIGCCDPPLAPLSCKKNCGSCFSCRPRPCNPQIPPCVCPCPPYTYEAVIAKDSKVTTCLQSLLDQIYDSDAQQFNDLGWSLLLMLAFRTPDCDDYIRDVLDLVNECPGKNPSYLVKYRIITLLLNSVVIDENIVNLLLLLVAYAGNPYEVSLCGQAPDIPSDSCGEAATVAELQSAFAACNAYPNANSCPISCVEDCCRKLYYFKLGGILPALYLTLSPQKDIVFNLLFIALLLLIELQKCNLKCFNGFCIQAVPDSNPPSGCFPAPVKGYVMNVAAHEFFNTVRNIYNKIKNCCNPQAFVESISPKYLFYLLLCHNPQYVDCVRKIMCCPAPLPCPPPPSPPTPPPACPPLPVCPPPNQCLAGPCPPPLPCAPQCPPRLSCPPAPCPPCNPQFQNFLVPERPDVVTNFEYLNNNPGGEPQPFNPVTPFNSYSRN